MDILLNFDSVELSGFQRFRRRAKLDLSGEGLTFVRGRNEVEPRLGQNDCGKTTLFNALAWGCYGRTVGGLRSPDIRSWSGESTPVVKIEVRAKTIERSPGKLLLDGDKSSQADIDQLLGINFDTFSHTVLLGQGRPLFFDLTPAAKMKLLAEVLMLERWEQRAQRATASGKELAMDIMAVQVELRRTEGQIEQTKELLKQAKRQAEEWEADRKSRIAVQRTSAKEIEQRLAKIGSQRDDADLKYDSAMTELKSLNRDVDKLQRELAVVVTARTRAEVKLEEHKRRRAEIKQWTSLKTDQCPTCGQPVKGTSFAKHQAELLTTLDDIIAAGIPKKINNAVTALEGRLSDARKHISAFEAKAEGARSTLDRVTPIVVELQANLTNLKSNQQQSTEESNPHRVQMQTLRQQNSRLEAEREDFERRHRILDRRFARTKFWVKGFRDIALEETEEVLQELELATNTLLPESGLDNWQVHYAIEKETKAGTMERGLNVSILSPTNTKPVRWEAWGGGVGQRLRVVGALALAEVLLTRAGVRTSLEVLDEPTQHMSREGVQDLCEFLARRAQTLGKRIFYIDHMAIESALFSNVINVVRTKAGSHIET